MAAYEGERGEAAVQVMLRDLAGLSPMASKVLVGYHFRNARVGVFAARRDEPSLLLSLFAWKQDPVFHHAIAQKASVEVSQMILAWQPVIPRDWMITTAPSGKSHGNEHYPAAILAKEVASSLGLGYETMLVRNDRKSRHGKFASLEQSPYSVCFTPPSVVLVIDDILTSGTTMRLSLEALSRTGIPAFGFAYYAND